MLPSLYYVISLVHVVQGLPGISAVQQLLNLFTFAVIECFGLILLCGRGLMPFLRNAHLISLINSTVGSIPRILTDVLTVFRHREDRTTPAGKAE